MANREREIQLKFRVTPQEREMIEQKMAQLGTKNMAAYLRKIAIDGYVIRLELPELKEMVSLLRRSSNNLNQLIKRVHEMGRVYDADLEDIVQNQERLWQAANDILAALAQIKQERMPLLRRRVSTETHLHFSGRILAKKYPERYGGIRNKKGGRYHEADIKNPFSSYNRCSDNFRLDLRAGPPLLGFCVRPCGNGPRHLRCAGADYSTDHKRDHPAGNGVPRRPVWNLDGGGVADRQDTGFAVCDSGPGLWLKKSV